MWTARLPPKHTVAHPKRYVAYLDAQRHNTRNVTCSCSPFHIMPCKSHLHMQGVTKTPTPFYKCVAGKIEFLHMQEGNTRRVLEAALPLLINP